MIDNTLPAIPMDHARFFIGMEFKTETGVWRCTDVGSRTILAIKISDCTDKTLLNGPPYAVAEQVFDETDFLDASRLDRNAAQTVDNRA